MFGIHKTFLGLYLNFRTYARLEYKVRKQIRKFLLPDKSLNFITKH